MLTWRNVLRSVGLVIVAVPLGALLVAYSGAYNVAADHGHPSWLDWFLKLGMRRSVELHSGGAPAPPLDDSNLVLLGAVHFRNSCAVCHGAPGEPIIPTFNQMLPSPPRLKEHVQNWSDEDLHWIVKHGLQFTGMPGWSGQGRDDEIWAVVAFLRALPKLDTLAYQAVSRGNRTAEIAAPEHSLRTRQAAEDDKVACGRCHDTADTRPASVLVPRLAGQSQRYLETALRQYKEGSRESGFMEPVAARLDEGQIAALAAYYAALPTEKTAGSADIPATRVQRGREIAINGVRSAKVPACLTCHGPGARASYPRLAGLSAEYIEAQLRLFRQGGRSGTLTGALMTEIAQRVSDQHVVDVAAYFEGAWPVGTHDHEPSLRAAVHR